MPKAHKPLDPIVAAMLPALSRMFLISDPAESARRLFDATEALEREGKIRRLQDALSSSQAEEVGMQRAADARNWKQFPYLAARFFEKLTDPDLLELTQLVGDKHKELEDKLQSGAEGLVAFREFGMQARAMIERELAVELLAAREAGRDHTPDTRADQDAPTFSPPPLTDAQRADIVSAVELVTGVRPIWMHGALVVMPTKVEHAVAARWSAMTHPHDD